jgi:nitroreductase
MIRNRRTIRDFSSKPISQSVIDNCIRSAGSAPSGANQQPRHFVVVSDPAKKREIRLAAEKEERDFYAGRAGEVWLDTLAPLGTDANKPFLEKAPVLIAIFEQKYRFEGQTEKVKHYYSKESTGIATGILITALHQAGLCTLTHTPSPMNFLNKLLSRPEGERPFLLLVVGYPAQEAKVPDIKRKSLDQIRTRI